MRLIGPERFTEICVAALGLDPARWVELFYGGEPFATPTETGLVLTLALHPQDAWLGEPRTLRLQVNDHGGTPRAGVAVTVQTSIGRLVYLYGFQRIDTQAAVPDGFDADPANDRDLWTLGVQALPIPQIAAKADYTVRSNGAGTGVDQWNVSLSYLF